MAVNKSGMHGDLGMGTKGRLFGEVGPGGARERRRREMRDAGMRDLGRGDTI